MNNYISTTDLEFKCSDGTLLTDTGGRASGIWSAWKECPKGYAIQGMRAQIEEGTSDDTGLNNIILRCTPSNKILVL